MVGTNPTGSLMPSRQLRQQPLSRIPSSCVTLFSGWETAITHIARITIEGIQPLGIAIKIAPYEFGFEIQVEAEQVVHDQDLAIGFCSGANANGGYGQ